MKLWAISDLHVGHPDNRQVIKSIRPHPEDWLILAGDLGESVDHLRFVFSTLSPRFGRLLWVPGNHELWTIPHEGMQRGEAKYQQLVALCREHRILTPEDEYQHFESDGLRYLVAPLFVLYDYSFAPEGMTVDEARAWALDAGLECADEHLLYPDPYPSRAAWCAARCVATEARLTQALRNHDGPTILINHFPLLLEHLPDPSFSHWCGTRRARLASPQFHSPRSPPHPRV